jgi:hypothetical protein
MPERWERQIARLHTVAPPAGLRARVDRGSSGDGVPPGPEPRQRIVAAVVATLVFAVAAGFAYDAFRGDPSAPLDDQPSPRPVVLADTLQLRCTAGGTEILTPNVRTHEDGVHVEVVEAGAAGDVVFAIAGSSWVTGRAGDDLATGSFVRGLFVGSNSVVCTGTDEGAAPPPTAGWATFEVVDDGRDDWTSVQLPCPPNAWEPINAHIAAPQEADLLDSDVVMRLSEIQPNDTVELAGYVMSPLNRTVRVVRDGVVIAWFEVRGPDLAAGWDVRGATCPGSSWFDETSGARS